VRTTHQILQKPVHQVRTATYKEEWADGYPRSRTLCRQGPQRSRITGLCFLRPLRQVLHRWQLGIGNRILSRH
jgi:hypothetical protein